MSNTRNGRTRLSHQELIDLAHAPVIFTEEIGGTGEKAFLGTPWGPLLVERAGARSFFLGALLAAGEMKRAAQEEGLRSL